MKVFHISEYDLGKRVIFSPRIPRFRARGENSFTKRICVGKTIQDCVVAKDEWQYDSFVYVAEVPENILHIPSISDVPDVNSTNEMWILDDTHFDYNCRIFVTRERSDERWGKFQYKFL